MADTPLFALDAKDRWRLAHDGSQLVLQKRRGKPGARSTGFVGMSFIATYKRILLGVLGVMREKGVELTPEARIKLGTLPGTFKEFRSAQTHACEPEEVRCKAGKPDLGTQTPETPVPALHAA